MELQLKKMFSPIWFALTLHGKCSIQGNFFFFFACITMSTPWLLPGASWVTQGKLQPWHKQGPVWQSTRDRASSAGEGSGDVRAALPPHPTLQKIYLGDFCQSFSLQSCAAAFLSPAKTSDCLTELSGPGSINVISQDNPWLLFQSVISHLIPTAFKLVIIISYYIWKF